MDEAQELAATIYETLSKKAEGLIDDNTTDVDPTHSRLYFSICSLEKNKFTMIVLILLQFRKYSRHYLVE